MTGYNTRLRAQDRETRTSLRLLQDEGACLAPKQAGYVNMTVEPWMTEEVAAAKAVCATCPVQAACLQWALDNRQKGAVWGGMDDDERAELLKRARRRKAPAGLSAVS